MYLALKKPISFGVTLLFFSQTAFGSLAESSFWAERRRKISQDTPQNQKTTGPQFASLSTPMGMNQITAKNVLKQMPSVGASLSNIPKWSQTNNGKYPSLSTPVKNLADAIPQIYANIQDIYDSGDTANPPIVLIQDVHLNPEAQTNIAAVLQELIDQNKLSLVGVEGSFTPFDFSNFRSFPDKEIARQVTESFLNKNLLAAPSFVGFTSATKPPQFIGIDDRLHYEANVNAYLETRNLKKKALDQISQIERNLSEAKRNVFSKDLLRFDHIRTAYHKGSMGFGQYVKKLASYASDHDLVIEQFLEAFKMESALDLARVERERKTVIEKLAKELNEEEVSLLVSQSLAYRSGRLGFGPYYQGLKDLCQRKGINLSRTRAFEDYIRYVLLSDGIKADELFESIGRQEKKVVSILAGSKQERELALISEQVSLIEKLIDFSLTPNEWDSYRKNQYSLKEIAEEISVLTNRPIAGIDRIISLNPFETFYHEADIRSHEMVKKLISNKNNGNRALVMGGFHAPQVAQILKDQKISHIILSPKITKVEGSGSSYLTVFAKEKTPLDRIFAGEKLFVYPSYLGVGANPEAVPTGRLWRAVGAIENAVHNPSNPIEGMDVKPTGEPGMYEVQIDETQYIGEHSLVNKEGDGNTQFVHTTIQKPTQATQRGAKLATRVKSLTIGLWTMLTRAFSSVKSTARFTMRGSQSREGGLIGKYQVLTKPVFDREKGEVRFRGRNIETNEEEDIVLEVEIVDQERIREMFFQQFHTENEVAAGILEWFLEGKWEGDVLILKPNKYGIKGIGTEDVIAVAEEFQNDFIAFFHELAEAMGASNSGLTAEAIVASLNDRTWFDNHMNKPGRKGLELHYAIRALQREAFTGMDRELSIRIKGLLSTRDIIRRAQAADVKYSPVLKEFRRQRSSTSTRDQEVGLLDQIITAQKEREIAEAEETARKQEEEERKAQWAKAQAESINERLDEAKKALDDKDAEYRQKQDTAIELIRSLQEFDEDILADEIAKRITQGSKSRIKWAWMDHLKTLLISEGANVLGPRVNIKVFVRLFRSVMDGGGRMSERASLMKDLDMLLLKIEELSPDQIAVVLDLLWEQAKGHFSRRASVSRFRVMDIPDYERYFDVDKNDPDTLFFKSDFQKRIVWIRNLEHRKRIERLYKEASYFRGVIGNTYWKFMSKDKSGVIFESLLTELINGRNLKPEVRAEIIGILTSNWHQDLPERDEKAARLIELIKNEHAKTSDPEIRHRLVGGLNSITLSDISPENRDAITSFMIDIMSNEASKVAEATQELKEADQVYADLKADSNTPKEKLEEARKEKNKAYKDQEDGMKSMELQLAIIASTVDKLLDAEPAEAKRLSDRLLAYLVEVADNDKWDPNIRSEAAALLQKFYGRNKIVTEWFIRNLQSSPLNPALMNVLSEDASPEEVINVVARAEGEINPRLVLLLLRRHRKNRDLMKRIVFDDSVDIKFRMAAFNWYSAEFLSNTKSDPDGKKTTTYDEKEYQRMVRALEDAAEDFARKSLSDGDQARRIFDDMVGQDEEAKIYITAIFLLMNKHLRHTSAKGGAMIANLIGGTRAVDYYDNANSGFRMGGRIFRRAPQFTPFFFQVIAHELMHDVLGEEIEYHASGLKNGIVHEMMSDLHAFFMSDILGIPRTSMMDALDFNEHFEDVQGDEFYSVEVHEGARAQLEVVRNVLAARGLSIDADQLVRAGLTVLRRDDIRDKNLEEVISLILRAHLGDVEKEETLKNEVAAFSFDSPFMKQMMGDFDEFEVEDDSIKQRILDFDRVAAIFNGILSVSSPLNAFNIFQNLNERIRDIKATSKGFRKIFLNFLFVLTHPITAVFTETLGLWGTSSLVNQLISAAALSDPTGLTLLAVIGIALIFALIHGDLWDRTTYKEGKITLGEFTSRFLQRFVGGAILTAPIMLIPGLGGILTSGIIHLAWNGIFLMRRQLARVPLLGFISRIRPLSAFTNGVSKQRRIQEYLQNLMGTQTGQLKVVRTIKLIAATLELLKSNGKNVQEAVAILQNEREVDAVATLNEIALFTQNIPSEEALTALVQAAGKDYYVQENIISDLLTAINQGNGVQPVPTESATFSEIISQATPGKALRVLCVCTMNYNRSPAMEAALKHLLRREGLEDQVVVTSGGNAVPGVGMIPSANPELLKALQAKGINAGQLAPKPITDDELRNADVILAADENNFNVLVQRVQKLEPNNPNAAKKVMLFTNLDPPRFNNSPDLPDPQGGEISSEASLNQILDVIEEKVLPVIKNRNQATGTHQPDRASQAVSQPQTSRQPLSSLKSHIGELRSKAMDDGDVNPYVWTIKLIVAVLNGEVIKGGLSDDINARASSEKPFSDTELSRFLDLVGQDSGWKGKTIPSDRENDYGPIAETLESMVDKSSTPSVSIADFNPGDTITSPIGAAIVVDNGNLIPGKIIVLTNDGSDSQLEAIPISGISPFVSQGNVRRQAGDVSSQELATKVRASAERALALNAGILDEPIGVDDLERVGKSTSSSSPDQLLESRPDIGQQAGQIRQALQNLQQSGDVQTLVRAVKLILAVVNNERVQGGQITLEVQARVTSADIFSDDKLTTFIRIIQQAPQRVYDAYPSDREEYKNIADAFIAQFGGQTQPRQEVSTPQADPRAPPKTDAPVPAKTDVADLWRTPDGLHEFWTQLTQDQTQFQHHLGKLRDLEDGKNVSIGDVVRALMFFAGFPGQAVSNEDDLNALFERAAGLASNIDFLVFSSNESAVLAQSKYDLMAIYRGIDRARRIFPANRQAFISRIQQQAVTLGQAASSGTNTRRIIQALAGHLTKIQGDSLQFFRTLKLILATADNDPGVLSTSGFPDEIQERLLDEDGSIKARVLIDFLRNINQVNNVIPQNRQSDYDPVVQSLLTTISGATQNRPFNIFQVLNDKLNQARKSATGAKKFLFNILYGLTHPITAAFTETIGFAGVLGIAKSTLGTAAFADPTGLSLSVFLILVGIGVVFSLIHGDLWDKSSYKGGWTWGKFIARFFARATAGTGFAWLLMFDGGIFWSLSAHLTLNVIYLIGASNNWRGFDSYLVPFSVATVPTRRASVSRQSDRQSQDGEFSDDAKRLVNIIQAISAGRVEQVIGAIPEEPVFISEIDGRTRVDGQRSFANRLNGLLFNVRFLSIFNNELSQLPSDFTWTDQNQELLVAVLLAIGLDRSQAEKVSTKLKADADRVFIFNEKKNATVVMAALIKAGATNGKPITILVNNDLIKHYTDIVNRMKGYGFKGKIEVRVHSPEMIANGEVDPVLLMQSAKAQLDNIVLILPGGMIIGSANAKNITAAQVAQLRRNTLFFNEFLPITDMAIGNIAERIRAILIAA